MVVKTTVSLDDELWKKFSIKVIQEFGGRKKTDIFEALAEAFVNEPDKTITEALAEYVQDKHKAKASKR